MTKNLYSQTNEIILRFLEHLNKVQDFENMSVKEQNELRFMLRSDSVSLENMLSLSGWSSKIQKVGDVE